VKQLHHNEQVIDFTVIKKIPAYTKSKGEAKIFNSTVKPIAYPAFASRIQLPIPPFFYIFLFIFVVWMVVGETWGYAINKSTFVGWC